jgi:integrase
MFFKGDGLGLLAGQNPVRNARVGQESQRQRQILSDELFRVFLAELPSNVALLVKSATSAATRISELLGLAWSSVDFERGVIRVVRR